MALIDQINVVNCKASEVLGTGLAGCQLDFGIIKAIALLERGYKFPTTGVTKSVIQTLQQQGKLIFLGGVIGFADKTPESNYETNANTGIKKLVLEMPYEFEMQFDNGLNFQKALTSLSGHSNYDMVLFDNEDRLWATFNKAGEVKGLSLGLHQKGNYAFKDGQKSSSQKLMLQLTDRNEIDLRACAIALPDASYTDFDGVNQVTLTSTGVSAGTVVILKAMLGDNSHLVQGLISGNFKATKNGAPLNVTAVSYTTNPDKITLTIPAVVANDVIEIQLYDNAIPSNIIMVSGTLYKSNKLVVTVA